MPRIENITVTPVAFREPPLLAASGMHQPWAIRTIIEMTVEGGHVGIGETYGDRTIWEAARKVADRLIGVEVTDINRMRREVAAVVDTITEDEARKGSLMKFATLGLRVHSGLEVAAYDAWGKVTGLPLYEILGGKVRDKVPFAAYLFYRFAHHKGYENDADDWGEVLTPEAMVDEAHMMRERFGFKSFKLKSGVFEPEMDVDSINQLYDALPGMPLRIDPNTNWSVETTKRLLPQFDGKLEYLEDPVAGQDAMAEIAAIASMPLATNMCTVRMDHLPSSIDKNAVGVILSDHHFWGGIDVTMHLAAICRTWDIGLSMHSNSHLGISLAAMTHIGAAVPQDIYDFDTHYSWEVGDIVEGGLIPFTDGCVTVPEGPGLGVSLDRAVFARMAEDYKRVGCDFRDDATEMKRHWPDWQRDPLPKF